MGKGDSAVSPAPAAAKLLPLLGTKEQAEETVIRTQAESHTKAWSKTERLGEPTGKN